MKKQFEEYKKLLPKRKCILEIHDLLMEENAALQMVEARDNMIDALWKRIKDLEYRFENHKHKYHYGKPSQ